MSVDRCDEEAAATASKRMPHGPAIRYVLLNLGDVGGKLIMLGTNVYLARVLGVTFFGIVIYFQSSAALLAMGTDCGLIWSGTHAVAGMRDAVHPQSQLMAKFNEVAASRLMLAFVVYAGWYAAAFGSPFLGNHLSLLVVFGASILFFSLLPEWVLLGTGLIPPVILGRLTRSLIFGAVTVIFVRSRAMVLWVAVAYTLACAVQATALLTYLGHRWNWRPRLQLRQGQLRMLIDAFPFFALSILGQLYFLVALMISREFVGPAELGEYAAATRMMTALVPFSGFAVTAMVPALGAASNTRIREMLSRTISRYITLIIPVVVITSVEARRILSMLLGSSYAASGHLFSIFIYSLPLLGISLFAGAGLNQMGNARRAMTVVLTCVMFEIISSYALTRLIGDSGVAVATLLSLILCSTALCASIEGLLSSCGGALAAFYGGAALMHFSLYALENWSTWFDATAARVGLEAAVVTVYLVINRSAVLGVIEMLRQRPSESPCET